MPSVYDNQKIWIDLDNSPHVPFFKPIVGELEKQGRKVLITARDCAQTCGLADLHNLRYKRIGRHYGKMKIMKILGTMYRSMQLLPIAVKERPKIAVSHGSRSQLITAWILRIPAVVIFDYEYTAGLKLIEPDWLIAPKIVTNNVINKNKQHVIKYSGIKEDVYVAGFTPNHDVRKHFNLSNDAIVVTIRPPATEAHYHNPESENLFIEVIEHLGQYKNLYMIILPRNEKSQTAFIKGKWSKWCKKGKIIIPNHVINGLDIIWTSDIVISGGGTMNRESAALGVPVYSIFRGKIGAVDRYLEKKQRLVILENVEDVRKKIHPTNRKKRRNPGIGEKVALGQIVTAIKDIIDYSASHRHPINHGKS